MIDWTSAILPCHHIPIKSGYLMSVSSTGEVEWESEKGFQVEGSYQSKYTVKSLGSNGKGLATHIKVRGNPSKFIQGHNLIGSSDLISLMKSTYLKLCRSLQIVPRLSDLRKVLSGDYEISRIDLTHSYHMNSRDFVLSWLRYAEKNSTSRHGKTTPGKGSTVYWGKHSRRWAIKAYSKGQELEASKAHRLPIGLDQTPLQPWSDNILRVEVVLRGMELDNIDMRTAKKWSPSRVEELFNEYRNKIDMINQANISDDILLKIPNRLAATYALWEKGFDLRKRYSKTKYYAHRKGLLEYGIDINIEVNPKIKRKSLVREERLPTIHELEPIKIPDWAFDMGLVHESTLRSDFA